MTNGYLSTAEFCKQHRVSARTAMRWRGSGEGPPWVRVGPRLILYPIADTEAWAEQRKFTHRAEELSRRFA